MVSSVNVENHRITTRDRMIHMPIDQQHPLSKLIAIAAKAGIGLLPGGGLLTAGFEGIQIMSEEAVKHMERRTQARFEDFIQSIFVGDVSPEVTEHLTADDYSALLSGCLEDMESEKAHYYGRLARAIGRSDVTGNRRRFMILTLRALSEAQLQMLRKSFIAVQFNIRPGQGAGNLDAKGILQLTDPIDELHYRDLVARSLYIEDKLAKIAADLVSACFSPEDLVPESIGRIAWHPDYLDIIFDTDQTGLINALSGACWNNAIKSTNRSVAILDRGLLVPTISPKVMIMGRDAAPDYLLNLKKTVKGGGVLFVSYHDHDQLIQEYFPGSIIIKGRGLSDSEVTAQVMSRIKKTIDSAPQ